MREMGGADGGARVSDSKEQEEEASASVSGASTPSDKSIQLEGDSSAFGTVLGIWVTKCRN